MDGNHDSWPDLNGARACPSKLGLGLGKRRGPSCAHTQRRGNGWAGSGMPGDDTRSHDCGHSLCDGASKAEEDGQTDRGRRSEATTPGQQGAAATGTGVVEQGHQGLTLKWVEDISLDEKEWKEKSTRPEKRVSLWHRDNAGSHRQRPSRPRDGPADAQETMTGFCQKQPSTNLMERSRGPTTHTSLDHHFWPPAKRRPRVPRPFFFLLGAHAQRTPAATPCPHLQHSAWGCHQPPPGVGEGQGVTPARQEDSFSEHGWWMCIGSDPGRGCARKGNQERVDPMTEARAQWARWWRADIWARHWTWPGHWVKDAGIPLPQTTQGDPTMPGTPWTLGPILPSA